LPKLPQLTAPQAAAMLLRGGFVHIRSKGSHRIYVKNNQRVIIPFHAGKTLHPKIVKQVLEALG